MTGTFAILGGWTTVAAAAPEGAATADRTSDRHPAGFERAVRRFWQAAVAARRLRQARRELLALDDQLLGDAGIARDDINAVIDDLARENRARAL